MLRSVKHKFFAKKTKRGDITFPSKLEAKAFDVLKSLQESGKILFFLRQIPVFIGGGHKYICDFLVFTQDDAFFIEVKGKDLPLGKLKRHQAEEILGVEIHVVTDPVQVFGVIS